MSLCFTDEHLAWQQRINKEKFAATVTQYFPLRPKKPSKSPIKVYDSRNSTPRPRGKNLFEGPKIAKTRLSSLGRTGLFPDIKSRDSSSKYSVNSSQLCMSDFEDKTVDQLKEILKQERIVSFTQKRLVAEQRLLELKMKETGELIKKLNNA